VRERLHPRRQVSKHTVSLVQPGGFIFTERHDLNSLSIRRLIPASRHIAVLGNFLNDLTAQVKELPDRPS
jgi:hypothetical protein